MQGGSSVHVYNASVYSLNMLFVFCFSIYSLSIYSLNINTFVYGEIYTTLHVLSEHTIVFL